MAARVCHELIKVRIPRDIAARQVAAAVNDVLKFKKQKRVSEVLNWRRARFRRTPVWSNSRVRQFHQDLCQQTNPRPCAANSDIREDIKKRAIELFKRRLKEVFVISQGALTWSS